MSVSIIEENSPTISTSSKIGENENVISESTVSNADPIIKKPVLGKDRAKKRLMAFAVKYNPVQKVDKLKPYVGKHKKKSDLLGSQSVSNKEKISIDVPQNKKRSKLLNRVVDRHKDDHKDVNESKKLNTYKPDFHKSRNQDGYREHRYKPSFVRGESTKIVIPDDSEHIQSYKFYSANDGKFDRDRVVPRRRNNDYSETRNAVPDLLRNRKPKHKTKYKSYNQLHEQTGPIIRYEDDDVLDNYDSNNFTTKPSSKSSSSKIKSSEKYREEPKNNSQNRYDDTFDGVKKSDFKKYAHSKQNSQRRVRVLEHIELDFNLNPNDEVEYKKKQLEMRDDSIRSPRVEPNNVSIAKSDHQENNIKPFDTHKSSTDRSSTTERIDYLNQIQSEETFPDSNKVSNSCIFNSWTDFKKNSSETNHVEFRRLLKMDDQVSSSYFEKVLMIKNSPTFGNDLKARGLHGTKVFPAESVKVTENSWPPVVYSENPKIFFEKLGRNILTVVTPDRKQIMDDICKASSIKVLKSDAVKSSKERFWYKNPLGEIPPSESPTNTIAENFIKEDIKDDYEKIEEVSNVDDAKKEESSPKKESATPKIELKDADEKINQTELDPTLQLPNTGQEVANTKLVFEYEEFMKIVNSSAVSTLDSSTSEDLLSTSPSTLSKSAKKTPLEGSVNYVACFNPVNSFSTHKYPFFHKNIIIRKKLFLKVLKKNLAQSVYSDDNSFQDFDISKPVNASLPAKFSETFPIRIEDLEQRKLPFHRFDGKTNFPFLQWPCSVEEETKEERQKRALFDIILNKDLHVWKKDVQLIYLHHRRIEDISMKTFNSLDKIYKKTKLKSYPDLFCKKINNGCKLFIYKRSKKDSRCLMENIDAISEFNHSYASNSHSEIAYDQLSNLSTEAIKENCFIPLSISSDIPKNDLDSFKTYLGHNEEINLNSIQSKNNSDSLDKFSLNEGFTPLIKDEKYTSLHTSKKKTSQKSVINFNDEANSFTPNREEILQNDSNSSNIKISDGFGLNQISDSILAVKSASVEKDVSSVNVESEYKNLRNQKIGASLFGTDIKHGKKSCLKKRPEKVGFIDDVIKRNLKITPEDSNGITGVTLDNNDSKVVELPKRKRKHHYSDSLEEQEGITDVFMPVFSQDPVKKLRLSSKKLEQDESENDTHLIQKLEKRGASSIDKYQCNVGIEEFDKRKLGIDFSKTFSSDAIAGYHGLDKKFLFDETNKSSPRRLSLDDRLEKELGIKRQMTSTDDSKITCISGLLNISPMKKLADVKSAKRRQNEQESLEDVETDITGDRTIVQTLKNISNNTESPTDADALPSSPGCVKQQTLQDNLKDIVPVYNYEAILEARQEQKKNREEIRIGKKRRKFLEKKEDQENMFENEGLSRKYKKSITLSHRASDEEKLLSMESCSPLPKASHSREEVTSPLNEEIDVGKKKSLPRASGAKKFVQFADGVRPGEGTSSSDGDDSFLDESQLNKDLRRKKLIEISKRMRKSKKLKAKLKAKKKGKKLKDNLSAAFADYYDMSPPPPPPGSPPPAHLWPSYLSMYKSTIVTDAASPETSNTLTATPPPTPIPLLIPPPPLNSPLQTCTKL